MLVLCKVPLRLLQLQLEQDVEYHLLSQVLHNVNLLLHSLLSLLKNFSAPFDLLIKVLQKAVKVAGQA